MTRDEANAAWYKKRAYQEPDPAVVARVKQLLDAGKRVSGNNMAVRAISLDGRRRYQIKRGPYFVALARNMTEVAQYVDLADLQEEK